MLWYTNFKEDHMVHKQNDKAIPELEDKEDIFAECHSMGHFGVTRTACLVRTNFWWSGLKDQVKKHVKECNACKHMHARFNEPLDKQPIPVEGVYHKVGVDMLGPLQNQCLWKPLHQYKSYINTNIHYMTKNTETAVVLDRSSRTTAEFFEGEVICRQSRQYQTKEGSFVMISKHC